MTDATRGVTLTLNTDASKFKAGVGDARASLDQFGASVAKLAGQIDPTVGKLDKLDAQLEQLKKFKSSGAISGDDFSVYAGKIDKARDSLTRITTATSGFGLQTNLAQREVAVLGGELLRGNTARFESSLITLARASGALALAMSGTGAAVLLTVGALAAVAIVYEKATAEADDFNRSIIATGNFAGTTTAQLIAQTTAIGAQTGHYGDAQQALTRLAATGQLTGKAFNEAAQGAVALSTLTGESIEKSVDEFNKLGGDPVKAVVELNDKYHFLTLAVYDQIKALHEQGDTEAATELAVKSFNDVLQQRQQAYLASLGPIGKAWADLRAEIEGALDASKRFLAGQTIASQGQQSGLAATGIFGGLLLGINALGQSSNQAADFSNTVAGSLGMLDKAAIAADDDIDKLSKSYDKNAERLKLLAQVQKDFRALATAPGPTSPRLAGVTQDANGNFSGGLVDQLNAAINAKFAGPKTHDNSAALEGDLESFENFAQSLAAKVGGPIDEAFQKYADTLASVDLRARNLVVSGADVTRVINAQNVAYANANKQLEKNIADIVLRNEKQATAGWAKDAQALADYSIQLDDNLDKLQAQIDAGGSLTNVQEAEFVIQQKLRGASQLEKDDLKQTTDGIRKKAAALDLLNAREDFQKEILGTLNSLIEGTRQGVINGENAFEALGKTAAQVLPGVANDLVQVVDKLKKAQGGTLDFSDALKGMGTELEKALPALGQLVGTVAGGGGQGAQIGSSLGSIVGLIATGGNPIGAAIGAVIGGLIGGAVGSSGSKQPAVYGSSIPGSVGRNGTAAIQTPLGIFASDTNNLPDDAYLQFEAQVKQFDISLAHLFDPAQLDAVQKALENFSGKFSDINSLLTARFKVILGTFDQSIQDFVTGFAGDLAGQVQALADVLSLQKLDKAGLLITNNFTDALNLITEFAQAGERVSDVYARLVTSTDDFKEGLALLGTSFDGDKTALVEFAQKISDAVGSTQAADKLWQTFFKDFFTQAQLTAANVTLLQSKATDSLTKIGLSADISMQDFKQKFLAALPNLTPEQVANWLQAGAALGDLNDAINSLVQQGETLVDELYGGGTLSDVNAQIAQLQGQMNQGSQAVQHLGSTVTQFAQNAKAAADLLLGDLSPLNNTQKLQYALTGLRNGTVTPEQVLQIGRALYASSQAYTDLFNMVRAIGDHTGASSNGNFNTGSTGSTTGGVLSQADQERLDQLIARRDQLQAQQRRQQANDLATTVANLALVQKESFQQVADELGFNLSDLAKDLGLDTDGLTKYLTNIQDSQTAIPDSITTNTDRQIKAMYDIAGKPLPPWAVDGGTNATTRSGVFVAPSGHSGHSSAGTSVAVNTANMADAQRLANTKLDQIISGVRNVELAINANTSQARTGGQTQRRNTRARQ